MADTAFPPSSLRPLIEEVSSLLKERKETVSVAETAAGGLLSASLLCVPGASAYFKGGLTLYTLESRLAFADWTPEHITQYRGPTAQIVADLAVSTRSKLLSTYTVSESGTAGPGGGRAGRTPYEYAFLSFFLHTSMDVSGCAILTEDLYRGVAFIAVAAPDGKTYTREIDTGFGDEREKNMLGFAAEGLKLLRDVIKGDAKL
ncbi:hypothetical protein UA08_04421 [Talaromyces atroroseus]|uniref:CinA C-terminal domain-containing protein n=1 Tax=Talaromyces atroroseus TaxID=1441469 RepID=A0A1Q5Q926_TALAT|nr:hypothetical protein UA08_04421 [Talaromyces atroroseus]OKL60460.1 hypothetical protein UA08_04421 [Talaromyces atroroseus]